MKLRLVPALLLLAFCFPALLLAQSPGRKISGGVTSGKFAGIEEGDYFWLLVTDSDGIQHGFLILNPDKDTRKILDNVSKYQGNDIDVTWEEREIEIPEAGGKIIAKIPTRVSVSED